MLMRRSENRCYYQYFIKTGCTALFESEIGNIEERQLPCHEPRNADRNEEEQKAFQSFSDLHSNKINQVKSRRFHTSPVEPKLSEKLAIDSQSVSKNYQNSMTLNAAAVASAHELVPFSEDRDLTTYSLSARKLEFYDTHENTDEKCEIWAHKI